MPHIEILSLAALRRPNPVLRSATIVSLVLLGGCSWFFPHADRSSNVMGDADTPRDGRCSLAVAESRKSLPEQVSADGIPTALIIHAPSSTAMNRGIGSREPVYFEAAAAEASSPPMSQPPLWQIEGVDFTDTAGVKGAMLVSGSVITLRAPQGPGYLRQSGSAEKGVGLAEGSHFMLYKADVPDATRPTTCDEQIRDQDFVFVRALDPSRWVRVNNQGVLSVGDASAGAPTPTAQSNGKARCARQEEQCHNDPRGGLVCVWAPVCRD